MESCRQMSALKVKGSQGERGRQGPTLPHPRFWERGEAPSPALSQPFSHQSP